MPKEITHLILSDEIAKASQRKKDQKQTAFTEIHDLVQRFSEAYHFGSVGPDFLYYDIPFWADSKALPQGIPWADTIHGAEGEDTMAHLVAMLEILDDDKLNCRLSKKNQPLLTEQKQMLLAFALGYLTHAGLDMELHPVVYHYSGNYYDDHPLAAKNSVTRHRVIETVLDLYLLDRYEHSYAEYNIYKKIKLPGKQRQLVLAFFTLALRMGYGHGQIPLCQETRGKGYHNIYDDALYATCERAYSKHLWASRFFQNRFAARVMIWLNSRFKNKLSEYSSLFYPAKSYQSYLKKGLYFKIEQITDYIDPITGKRYNFNVENKFKKIIARARRMVTAYYATYKKNMSLEQLRAVLPGASLNNGRLDAPVRHMVHYNPLGVNGSFKEVV